MNERALTGRDIARERITVSVNEFIEMSSFSRNMVYKLIKRGDIRTIKEGKRRFIYLASYYEFIAEKGEGREVQISHPYFNPTTNPPSRANIARRHGTPRNNAKQQT
jgi:hypothetical protein